MKNFISVEKTEEEKVEELKEWLKNNLLIIILGIGIGLAGVFSWQWYTNQQAQQKVDARALYLNALKDSEVVSIDHPEYQNQLLFMKAKNAATTEEALSHLRAVQSEEITRYVRDIKLAQVYLDSGNYQEALALLENNPLRATSLHLSGDIYSAMDEPELALETYIEAQNNSDNTNLKNILQVKINNLK